MRRLPAVLLAVATSLVVLPSAARADTTAETGVRATGLTCTVSPAAAYLPAGREVDRSTSGGYCTSPRPSYRSVIVFRVEPPVAGGGYSWALSGAPLPPTCTATAPVCRVTVNNTRIDRIVTATVDVTGGGQVARYTAEGWALGACAGPHGPEFC